MGNVASIACTDGEHTAWGYANDSPNWFGITPISTIKRIGGGVPAALPAAFPG